MNGFVVQEGGFGHRRKMTCCGKAARAGESIIAFEKKMPGGAMKGHIMVHRRCMLDLCESLPMDAADAKRKMAELREEIIATGNPFPKSTPKRHRRGSARELAKAR